LITESETGIEAKPQTRRWTITALVTVAGATVLAAAAFIYKNVPAEADVVVLPDTSQDLVIQDYSSSARCILCYPNQCTLDYSGHGAWTNCPASHPYFSEAACGCVSSASQCSTTLSRACSLCHNCHTTACNINGKTMVCGASTPYYEPNSGLCASSCVPPPGPAPPPYSSSSRRRRRRKSETTTTGCQNNTGGTCQVFSCKSSRGPTTCSGWSGGYKCLCKSGYCVKDGTCVQSYTR